MMVGINEFDDWCDIDRQTEFARKLLIPTSSGPGNNDNNNSSRKLYDLGSITNMLEIVSTSFTDNEGEPMNQIGHIINVLDAAQQVGLGASSSRLTSVSTRGRGTVASGESDGGEETSRNNGDDEDSYYRSPIDEVNSHRTRRHRPSVTTTPEDAANMLQFNALLLGPYQVELLFVLCTLLGGRRKIDGQEILKKNGLIQILEELFQRLPWDTCQSFSERDTNGISNHGLHGPGCECILENALCVQYLRLLHNFCDRDCDNYYGRRLLLSDSERQFIFGGNNERMGISAKSQLLPGLLSKIIVAFIGGSDESPYRFWLASYVESFLRGSSSDKQIFVARSGLMEHLIVDVTSKRLHCSGSLQTSFDLLGELCKGNIQVLRILADFLNTEEKFRKLMSVAALNLVDSNVFFRSMILAVERMSDENNTDAFNITSHEKGGSASGFSAPSYLTHSWWDSFDKNDNVAHFFG